MKRVNTIASVVCRLVVTFQRNPHGSLILVLLAAFAVAAL